MGQKISRTQIELTEDESARTAGAYHAWRGQPDAGEYADESGFCKAATLGEIVLAGCPLTPGRYVGAAVEEEDEAQPVVGRHPRSRPRALPALRRRGDAEGDARTR